MLLCEGVGVNQTYCGDRFSYAHISNPHIVHFKLMPCCVSIMHKKKAGRKHGKMLMMVSSGHGNGGHIFPQLPYIFQGFHAGMCL